jgi:hypothetical protein
VAGRGGRSRAAGQGKMKARARARATRASTATTSACKQVGGQAGQGRDCEAARLREGVGGRKAASRVGLRLAIRTRMMWLLVHTRKTAPPRRLTSRTGGSAAGRNRETGPHGSRLPGGLQ